VPSRFEPCGLVQMYAQRYGAIPVVRRVGGLVDTVVDIDVMPASATGIVFDDAGADALVAAIGRALRLIGDAGALARVRRNAMEARFDWSRSAARYLQIYDTLFDSSAAHIASAVVPGAEYAPSSASADKSQRRSP